MRDEKKQLLLEKLANEKQAKKENHGTAPHMLWLGKNSFAFHLVCKSDVTFAFFDTDKTFSKEEPAQAAQSNPLQVTTSFDFAHHVPK